MAVGKWIGGILGFIQGGPLGALAGFALGWLFDKGIDAVNDPHNNPQQSDNGYHAYQQYTQNRRQYEEGQRNSFLFSLLTLTSYIIRADGKVMHSEMEMVRTFLRQNFGPMAVDEGEKILLKLFEHQKQVGWNNFRSTIYSACLQIRQNMDDAQRLQLLHFLVMIAQVDGQVVMEEINALKEIAANLGISAADVDSMLNLRDSSSNLEAAYKVLGVSPSATDDEVKKAYRAMALKHHPDRVSALGEDVSKAAEKKFQEINNAKESIYKARNL
ncbi:MAG: TerB family tellurite resistance protein [Prevotella sp.]